MYRLRLVALPAGSVFADVPDVEDRALVDMAPLNGIELPLLEP